MILRVCHQFGNKQTDCEAKILAQPSAAGNPRPNSHKWVKWPRGREETFWQGSPMHWIQNLCERLLKEQVTLRGHEDATVDGEYLYAKRSAGTGIMRGGSVSFARM